MNYKKKHTHTQLVLHEEKKKRASANRRHMHEFREGAKVKAIYEDADNDPAVSELSNLP